MDGMTKEKQTVIDWVKEKQDNTIQVASKWGYSYVANFDPNVQMKFLKYS